MLAHFRQKRARFAAYLTTLFILLSIALMASLMIGSYAISPHEVLDVLFQSGRDPVARSILLNYRVPRTLMASITGFVLGVSGGVIQTLTRNPLADPYITGISSGAALGAAVAFIIPFLPIFSVPFFAFMGGFSALLLTMFLAKKANAGPIGFILAGIAVGTFASAVLMIVLALVAEKAHGILNWIYGSFSTSTWTHVTVVSPIVVPAVLYLFIKARDLNILLFGEEHATQLGIRAKTLWRLMLVVSNLAISTCVSFSGIIGFIGLVAPHMVRLMVSSDNRFVLPLAGFTGALLLLFSDDLVRSPMNPIAEIPVGAVTSLIGVPFFVYLLLRRGSRFGM
ncbi:MAG: FecCD family ABC transporter permease [Candidatus Methanomethylicaceae archaeon]